MKLAKESSHTKVITEALLQFLASDIPEERKHLENTVLPDLYYTNPEGIYKHNKQSTG